MEEEKKEPPTAVAPARYPLAYDSNGEPLTVPSDAVAWRVRRGGGRRGRPRNVFNTSGRQLEIPIGATIDELVNEGCEPDNYLLYAIDAAGRALPGVIAVTEVAGDEEDAAEGTSSASASNELTALGHALATIRSQTDAMSRALDHTTRGYAPVTPHVPVPIQPSVALAEQSAPPSGVDMAQVMGVAKMVMDLIRGAMPSSAAPPASGT